MLLSFLLLFISSPPYTWWSQFCNPGQGLAIVQIRSLLSFCLYLSIIYLSFPLMSVLPRYSFVSLCLISLYPMTTCSICIATSSKIASFSQLHLSIVYVTTAFASIHLYLSLFEPQDFSLNKVAFILTLGCQMEWLSVLVCEWPHNAPRATMISL